MYHFTVNSSLYNFFTKKQTAIPDMKKGRNNAVYRQYWKIMYIFIPYIRFI